MGSIHSDASLCPFFTMNLKDQGSFLYFSPFLYLSVTQHVYSKGFSGALCISKGSFMPLLVVWPFFYTMKLKIGSLSYLWGPGMCVASVSEVFCAFLGTILWSCVVFDPSFIMNQKNRGYSYALNHSYTCHSYSYLTRVSWVFWAFLVAVLWPCWLFDPSSMPWTERAGVIFILSTILILVTQTHI